jgi:glutamate synthase (NADPH/NADH) large chain
VKKVRDGAELLVLTDRVVYDGERRYLDPHLATSAVDQALKSYRVAAGEENLRRRCSIVLRSAAIRNVHDVVLALGLGANGVCPYVLLEVICVDDYAADVNNICSALGKGIEKVISTIGIHETRGYARQPRRSASTPRSTRRRSRRQTARPTMRTTRARCAGSRPRVRSRCATSWG